MPVQSAVELRSRLFDEYGGFADKRLKDLERDAPFIVDDRDERDRGADGHLYGPFVQLLVQVEDRDLVQLKIRGDLPTDAEVQAWLQEHSTSDSGGWVLVLSPADVSHLQELSKLVRGVTRKRYDTPAYKYSAPRTARSLARLAQLLSDAWST